MNIFFRVLTLSLCFLITGLTFGQNEPNWLRYPAISPDGSKIVFTYKGDLYSVATSGGKATQLTFHEAHDFKPVWSKDSKQIAFSSDRYGNFDVFIMNADGGDAFRLTYHSADEMPYDFSADGQNVIFGATRMDIAEHRQYPTNSQPELYQVTKKGGRIEQVWTTPAEYVQTNKDGSKMIYHDKKGGENEWRKHHQSGIARDIWIYDAKSNSHTMLTKFYGEDRNPVFSPDEAEIFYLSEGNGNFNVFSMSVSDPAQTKALTNFTKFPVRFLTISSDGNLCFSYDGELYTMKKGQQPQKVKVSRVA